MSLEKVVKTKILSASSQNWLVLQYTVGKLSYVAFAIIIRIVKNYYGSFEIVIWQPILNSLNKTKDWALVHERELLVF